MDGDGTLGGLRKGISSRPWLLWGVGGLLVGYAVRSFMGESQTAKAYERTSRAFAKCDDARARQEYLCRALADECNAPKSFCD